MFNSKKKLCGNRNLSHGQKKNKERIFKPHELQEYKGVHNIESVGSLDSFPVTSSVPSPTPEAEPSISSHRLPESSCSPSQAGPCSVSFESLLLQKISKNPTSGKKVKSQLAEIVTRDQFLETLPKEIPKTKTRRTKNSDPENSEDNFSVHDSNSSDGPYVEEEEECLKQLEFPTNIAVGSWILVKYSTKKTLRYYVGQILEERDEMIKVKFLRRKGNYFIWPTVEDISSITEDDVVRVLPAPKTKRRDIALSLACLLIPLC